MANQYRKYQLTFNNPLDHGFSHDEIKDIIGKFKSTTYWCMSDEVGESGTPHTHLYIVFENGVLWDTLQKRFNGAHIEIANGTSQENRDYVFKEGKWLADPKGETNIRDTHEEYGDLPIERPGKRNDLDMLYDMIKNGLSNYEILEQNPKYLLHIDKIEKGRKIYQEETFKNTWRDLEVVYIWGCTGAGKTRGVKEKYGYSNVYSVTDYAHPFDGYQGQDVILFEEFRSNIRISDMLVYLDGYPVDLPCRYANKVACFTKVYFCTNIDLRAQYRDIQIDYPETWEAFLRRVNRVKVYTDMDCFYTMGTIEYLSDMFHFFKNEDDAGEKFVPIPADSELPFD